MKLYLEIRKTKTRLLQIVLPVLLFLFLYCLYGNRDLSAHDLSQGYFRAIMQFFLLNAILLPLTLAAMASRLWDMEQKGSACKLLYTLEQRSSLFHSKLALAALHLAFLCLAETFLLLLTGRLFGFTQLVPFGMLAVFTGTTFLISFSILLLQMLLSFLFTNQLCALFIGILGSFIGLFTFFLYSIPLLRFLTPWGYYSAACFIQNTYDEKTRISDFFPVPFDGNAMILILAFSAALYLAGRYFIMKKEV